MYLQRLVTIIRADLPHGYQLAQATHSVAEYVLHYGIDTLKWNTNSDYVLVLACDNESHLEDIAELISDTGTNFRQFYEPDIDAYTSITFLSNTNTDEITKDMPLAGYSTSYVIRFVERQDTPQEVPQ